MSISEDVSNLVQSSQPTSRAILVGDEMIYTEGIVCGRVRIVEIKEKGDNEEYVLETLQQIGRFPLPKQFECGRKKNAGYCGWSLRWE